MSDTTGQQKEPTMEEILASIRRIISEEGDAAPVAKVAPSEAPVPDDQDDEILDMTNMVQDDEDSDDGVVDLTEMVSDDGSVVDLNDSAEPLDLVPEPEPEPFVPEPEPVIDLEPEPEPEPFVPEPEPEPEPFVPEPEPEPVFEPEPEPVMAPKPAPQPRPTPRKKEPPRSVPRSERPPEERSKGNMREDENLVSDMTRRATEGAFAQLTHALSSQSGALGSGENYQPQGVETVEGMVYAILKPMLKSWLDQNLPGMVERMVQAEIEKMTRDG